jgi:DNA-binding IclR family transcriptional regulator
MLVLYLSDAGISSSQIPSLLTYPESTASRWLKVLEEDRLVRHEMDANSAPASRFDLTAEGYRTMNGYLDGIDA